MNKFELEERLIDFAVSIVEITNELPDTKAGNHLAGQLVRSGTAPDLNYGEAQSGESRKDFVHKIKIVLKELRETFVCLNIINRAKLYSGKRGNTNIQKALDENNELISIFVRSVETARRNMPNEKNARANRKS
ncbi:MAG TPA: four helix bundle protein [Balneolales bacterium]|jgi:four helix bundle protein|nr:four helix bundle protein [Balneolales bacterium]